MDHHVYWDVENFEEQDWLATDVVANISNEDKRHQTTEKPFSCLRCGRSYKRKASLNSHLANECGKEPQFQCPRCSYRCKVSMLEPISLECNIFNHSNAYVVAGHINGEVHSTVIFKTNVGKNHDFNAHTVPIVVKQFHQLGQQDGFKIRTVNVVHEKKEPLLECFQTIMESETSSITINEASTLVRTLEDPEFIFWLNDLTVGHLGMYWTPLSPGHQLQSSTDEWNSSAPSSSDSMLIHACPHCTKRYKFRTSLYRHLKFECGKEPSFHCPHCSYMTKQKHQCSVTYAIHMAYMNETGH
ncbi:hypothetical protein ANN_25158 [Periplaneta americana]|uniref:C2H2-type domain-containing protein n=1 Tax=Periplaneta americana TaxID=6978 RepID=A0ABQ8S0U2_PERAM|nr:hypothetical protein ANN_25158 [Periplaneta americana]